MWGLWKFQLWIPPPTWLLGVSSVSKVAFSVTPLWSPPFPLVIIVVGTFTAKQRIIDEQGLSIPIVQHVNSGMLHARESPTKLYCGRIYSRFYTVVKSDLILRWPKCDLCSRRTPNPLSAPAKSKAPPPEPSQASSSKDFGAAAN